ncbi:DUF2332 domain-containing protein [Acidisphaera sp. L21]|uniref:DUF2332 domain-containing protein n=1 Tax=Acidisphaera sp. L21 TaxID=1641851 RepID=UPI001C20A9B6|nr:DUF2332 family protein [Acidisphaera sp. L21]
MSDTVLAAFGKQIDWCNSLGSPFTARVLGILADDFGRGGATAELAADWTRDPIGDALALRFAGALHAVVLTDAAPALAACYPPRGSTDDALRAAVLAALDERRDYIRNFLLSPPQTNEVGRSGVLLGGFLHIARATGLPLRTLEIGASAGLNLVWDQYHYTLGSGEWGDATCPVRLAPEWTGGQPALGTPVQVVSRRACDVAPVDLEDPAQRLRLRAFIWADQLERLARLEAAITIARAAGHRVEQADAATWVRDRLAEAAPGCTTVLYHSIMWQYMPQATRDAISATIAQASAAATRAAPFAWLRFEPARVVEGPEMRCTVWPGGEDVQLATAHAHGSTVQWQHGAMAGGAMAGGAFDAVDATANPKR